KEYNLQAGQSMVLDTGYLAAMSATCTMEIQSVAGIKNKLFGGEGFFNTVVNGPGKIWIQSMPISAMAGSLAPFIVTGH
ncbi:MAG: AIM24 family protein, partial [Lachnospiraceae bacterium]|nr:AIM24 family protein [Lachnospiraceae bacterium]